MIHYDDENYFSQCLSMQEIKFALKKTHHLFFAALKSKLSTSNCIKMNSMNSPRCSSTRYSIWCLCTVLAESQPVMLAKHFMALTRIRSDENLKSHWTGCAGMCVYWLDVSHVCLSDYFTYVPRNRETWTHGRENCLNTQGHSKTFETSLGAKEKSKGEH